MAEQESDNSPRFDRRPWGTFTVLDEADGFKVKRIEVLPGKRLSYQKHARRAEHWVVVQGTAKVTLDDRDILVAAGEAVDIAIGAAHRVENPGVRRWSLSKCSAAAISGRMISCVCRMILAEWLRSDQCSRTSE